MSRNVNQFSHIAAYFIGNGAEELGILLAAIKQQGIQSASLAYGVRRNHEHRRGVESGHQARKRSMK